MTTPDFTIPERPKPDNVPETVPKIIPELKVSLDLKEEELAAAHDRILQLEGELSEVAEEAERGREASDGLSANLLAAYHELVPYVLAERDALRRDFRG